MAPNPPLKGAAAAKKADKGQGSSRQNSAGKEKGTGAKAAAKGGKGKKKTKSASDLSPVAEDAPAAAYAAAVQAKAVEQAKTAAEAVEAVLAGMRAGRSAETQQADPSGQQAEAVDPEAFDALTTQLARWIPAAALATDENFGDYYFDEEDDDVDRPIESLLTEAGRFDQSYIDELCSKSMRSYSLWGRVIPQDGDSPQEHRIDAGLSDGWVERLVGDLGRGVLSQRDAQGCTLMHYAAGTPSQWLAAGASPIARDHWGVMAFAPGDIFAYPHLESIQRGTLAKPEYSRWQEAWEWEEMMPYADVWYKERSWVRAFYRRERRGGNANDPEGNEQEGSYANDPEGNEQEGSDAVAFTTKYLPELAARDERAVDLLLTRSAEASHAEAIGLLRDGVADERWSLVGHALAVLQELAERAAASDRATEVARPTVVVADEDEDEDEDEDADKDADEDAAAALPPFELSDRGRNVFGKGGKLMKLLRQTGSLPHAEALKQFPMHKDIAGFRRRWPRVGAAGVNAADPVTRRTPLHYAAYHRRVGGCLLLLELGADPTVVDASGMTAAEVAERRGHVALARGLREVAQHQPLARVSSAPSVVAKLPDELLPQIADSVPPAVVELDVGTERENRAFTPFSYVLLRGFHVRTEATKSS